ncbi:MAG: DMT family transporter [Desulfofustis sp.]
MESELKTNRSILLPISAMLLFWAFTPISIAWIKDDFSLIFQVWLRYLSAALMLWPILLTKKSFSKDFQSFTRKRFYFLLRISVIALCTLMFQILYTWCFFLISPGFGILLYQSQVIFSVLLGIVYLKSERDLIRQPGTVAGIMIALVGACLAIIFQSRGFSVELNRGILLALTGALFWALVGLELKIWIEGRLTPLFTVTMVFSLVSICLLPSVFLSSQNISGDPHILKWIVLVVSGLLGIGGGQALFYYLLPQLGIITTSSTQLLVPFLTGVFSFLLFDEKITLLQLIGGILLLGGCQTVLQQKRKFLTRNS